MKIIRVVAAVIFRTVNSSDRQMACDTIDSDIGNSNSALGSERQVFATQRGYGEYKDGWEFPGGKIEEGETAEQALVREIHEELDTEITVGKKIGTIEYDYPTFHLSMDCFECEIVSGKLTLLEHENSAWLSKETLHSVDWLPADLTILSQVESFL